MSSASVAESAPVPVVRRRLIALVPVLAVLLALAGLAPASAGERDYPTTAAVAQQAVEEALAATGATSLSAGLTDTSGLIWQGSAGVVDASGARPGPTTQYGIGSTSKMIATAAVMQLVDEGRVGLDQPVVRYLPQFTMRSPEYRQITVRMLLDHSAGLPGSSYGNIQTTVPYDDYADGVLANLARSRLKTTPGAMSVYCNDCFTVAGELVAEVSGMPYTAYVERHLLEPLGMAHSSYLTDELPARGSVGRVVVDGRTMPLEVFNAYATGGLMSTPEDMLAFARMLLAGGEHEGEVLLSGASIDQMGRSQLATTLVPISRNVFSYGLGWDSVRNLSLDAVGVRAWVKGGDTTDYHAGLVVAPEAGLAAFVTGAGPAGTLSSTVAEGVAEQILMSALAERGEIPAVPERLGTEQPPAVTPTEDDVNAIVGTFLGSSGTGYRLTRGSGDTIALEVLSGGSWVSGRHSSYSFRADGAWWPDTPTAQSFRAVTGWGRTYLVTAAPIGYGNAYGELVMGQRIAATGPVADAWRGRLGQWLLVGEGPTSVVWRGSPVGTIARIPGVPGYLDVSGLSPVDATRPDRGSMFLQVPLMFGRDLDDLVVVRPGVMRMGVYAMVQRDRVPALTTGGTQVRIGPQGYAVWREVPAAGRVTVGNADAWFLYDEDVSLIARGPTDAGSTRAPADSLLVVLGEPGDVIDVRLR